MPAVTEKTDLERSLADAAARDSAILDPANAPEAVAAILEAKLPAGAAPPEPEFWNRPEWWETAAALGVLLTRPDAPGAIFERAAAKGLWTIVAGDGRAPAGLLVRAAREIPCFSARAMYLLTENPGTPEAALEILRQRARPRTWETLLGIALWPVAALVSVAGALGEAARWTGHLLLGLAIPVSGIVPYRQRRSRRFQLRLTRGARERARLREALASQRPRPAVPPA